MSEGWFSVDKAGLSQVLGRQTPARAIAELIANAWDEPGVTRVKVGIWAVPGVPKVRITVEDDAPDGFRDLTESYVLFAASRKKTQPEARGRFNVGEKLFLARCTEATIESTSGTVMFRPDGSRSRSNAKLPRGTLLTAIMPMTRAELEDVQADLEDLIPPQGIRTTIWVSFGPGLDRESDLSASIGAPDLVFRAKLPTELADAEGNLRPAERETEVEVWRHGSGSQLYELGIPVVSLDGPFGINVKQKVPLTLDRENVKPAFLRRLRVAVLDRAHHLLQDDESKAEWVTEALAEAAPDTVSNLMDARFGKKRVSYDPSDVEANKRAASEGFTVVPGGSLPANVWANVREAGAIKPAGQVTPSKKVEFDPDGEDVTLPYAEWTPAMRATFKHLMSIGEALLAPRTGLTITLVKRLQPADISACYARGGFLTLNVRRLGRDWFERGADGLAVEHVDLLLHELGHEWSMDHCASEYHDALTRLGARLALMLVNEPQLRKALRRESQEVPTT